MAERPTAPPERPGWGGVAWIALPTCFFAVRAGIWWRALARGSPAVAALSAWDWARLVFVHVAAFGGLLVLAGMVREQVRREGRGIGGEGD